MREYIGKLVKPIRRCLAKLFHKHHWTIIHTAYCKQPQTEQDLVFTLARCYCGEEQAVMHYPDYMRPLNPIWYRAVAKKGGYEILDDNLYRV